MAVLTRGVNDIVRPPDDIVISDGGGTISVDDNSGSLTVDGTVAATQSGVWQTKITNQTILFATGVAGSNGNNTLVADPGSGQAIRIVALMIQNESAVKTTAIVYFGATAKWRFLAKEEGVGYVLPIPPGHVWSVGVGNALVLNLNGANNIGYNVAYYLE